MASGGVIPAGWRGAPPGRTGAGRDTADGVQVEDWGSKNGTHVNGVRIEGPTALQDGDVVQVAFTLELVFVARDATLPLEGPGFGRVGRLRMDARSHQVWLAGKENSPPLSPPETRTP